MGIQAINCLLIGGKSFDVAIPKGNDVVKSECTEFQSEGEPEKTTTQVKLMSTKDGKHLNCLNGGCKNCGYES